MTLARPVPTATTTAATTDVRADVPVDEQVTLRRATPADAATVHLLVREIAEHEGDLDHVVVTPELWRTILGRDDVVVLVAERGGHPLGYVSAVRRLHLWSGRDVLAVDDVFVRAGERGQGLGQQLLVAVAAFAAPEHLLVTWGVEPGNTGAQRFYRRLGATLRPKVIAGWAPMAYLPLVASAGRRGAGQGREQ